MATATYATDDPFAASMNPTQPTQDRTYFGEVVTVDAWFCVLEKGKGKRVFDPTTDDINQRSTAITISVECAKRDGGTYTVDQDVLDWTKEWREFTLPSLRQLGVDVRNLKGQFVQVKRQPTGETYKNKQDEVKNKSALVFMATYPDLEAMRVASEVFYTPRNGQSEASAPATQPEATDSGERAFALDTLNALWKFCKGDKAKFLEALRANPMVLKHFPEDSDEVKDLLMPF
jgi:hypothetical protein